MDVTNVDIESCNDHFNNFRHHSGTAPMRESLFSKSVDRRCSDCFVRNMGVRAC